MYQLVNPARAAEVNYWAHRYGDESAARHFRIKVHTVRAYRAQIAALAAGQKLAGPWHHAGPNSPNPATGQKERPGARGRRNALLGNASASVPSVQEPPAEPVPSVQEPPAEAEPVQPVQEPPREPESLSDISKRLREQLDVIAKRHDWPRVPPRIPGFTPKTYTPPDMPSWTLPEPVPSNFQENIKLVARCDQLTRELEELRGKYDRATRVIRALSELGFTFKIDFDQLFPLAE